MSSALGLGLGLNMVQAVRPAPGPGPSAPITVMPLDVPAAVHLHANYSIVATSGGRVVTATDLKGLAPASEGEAGLGPFAMTDGNGRKFWRFNGSEFLKNVADLVADARAIAVYMVVRQHRNSSATFFAQSTSAAPTNTGGALNTSTSGGLLAPVLRGQTTSASSLANKYDFQLGAQMQVIGVASRPSAGGGQRLHMNGFAASVAQGGIGTVGIAGYEIGRNPFAPQAVLQRAVMDVYEVIVVTSVLTNAQSDAVAAAMVAAWDIPTVTNHLVLEGDSITAGTGSMSNGENLAMALTDPGVANGLPRNWRVINVAGSGAKIVPNMVTRRDQANGTFDTSWRLPSGRNVVALQAGINDLGDVDALTTYGRLVALINTASTGYLQRGWSVASAINIASTVGRLTGLTALRALLRDPQFLVDLDAGPGGTYAGKVTRIELPLITYAPYGTIFSDNADSADNTFYQGDALHPNTLATSLMARGGDTPQYGYASLAA